MNFLVPLGFLFALFLPAVIVLYLLKLKRIDTAVSSTLLWKQTLEDLRANAPLQKLKNNLLMFLQLIAIAFLTLAAARPVLQTGGLQGESYIVLIDQSAGMSADDETPNRLEAAKEKAVRLVNDLSRGDQMMVIAFSTSARVLNAFTQEKAVLRDTIRSIQPTDNPTRIQEALSIAASSAELHPNVRLVIISDGRLQIPEDAMHASMDVSYIPIGRSSNNVGIVDVIIRNDFERQSNQQALVAVQNFSHRQQDVFLELYGIPEETDPAPQEADNAAKQLMDAHKLSLQAGQRETVIFQQLGANTAVIEVLMDVEDHLAADNRVWAVVPTQKNIDVGLVTPGNPYLQRALNVDPRVQLSIIPPNGYLGPQNHDFIVFDSFSPPSLTNGHYVFINSVPNLPGWSMGDTLEFPTLVDWNRMHPLNQYLSYENLVIQHCKNTAVPGWAEVILESRQTPLISAFTEDQIVGVVIGFDLYDSNWPLRVSFPIFISNLIDWFQNRTRQSQSVHRTGDILTLPPPSLIAEDIQLSGPQDYHRTIRFNQDAPAYISDIQHTGIYSFKQNQQTLARFAFNLLSAEESDIAPAASLVFGSSQVQGDRQAFSQNQEIWRYLILGSLAVIVFEWLLFVKRAKYSLLNKTHILYSIFIYFSVLKSILSPLYIIETVIFT